VDGETALSMNSIARRGNSGVLIRQSHAVADNYCVVAEVHLDSGDECREHPSQQRNVEVDLDRSDVIVAIMRIRMRLFRCCIWFCQDPLVLPHTIDFCRPASCLTRAESTFTPSRQ
jgi:hypothetical protein